MKNPSPPDQFIVKKQRLAFLYLMSEELGETIRFAGALLKSDWVIDGAEHSSLEVKALDLAVVISYSRPFKKNYGFDHVRDDIDQLLSQYTPEQLELHKQIIDLRDREFAHADADAQDITVYLDGLFMFMKRVTRKPLERQKVQQLIEMIRLLLNSINKQIEAIRSILNQATIE
jgi:hypothetical protein